MVRELPSVQPSRKEQEPCDKPDKCHECDKILTCKYYKEPCDEPKYTGNEFFNFDAPMVKKSMDAISREAVLQELTFIGGDIEPDDLTCIFRDRIKQLPSVQPIECDDAISRNAVVQQLEAFGEDFTDYRELFTNILNLPSVQPRVQERYWISKDNNIYKLSDVPTITVPQINGIDMVSREQVLNVIADFVTFEEYIDENHRLTFVPLEKKINMMPSVQPKPIECDDCVSRDAVVDLLNMRLFGKELFKALYELPSVQPSRKGHCKDCKYFERDSVAKLDNMPLIVAHEVCRRWGNGCKTNQDGYCHLFESADMRGAE